MQRCVASAISIGLITFLLIHFTNIDFISLDNSLEVILIVTSSIADILAIHTTAHSEIFKIGAFSIESPEAIYSHFETFP